MKVIDYIKQAHGQTLFSLEIIPPKKGENMRNIFDHLDPLMVFKPPFINVTYHREEYVYKKHPSGLLEKKTTRKRPGTVGICAALKHRYDIDPVPHMICGGFTKEETENALIDLNFLGIDNVLVLRGDAIKSESRFKPEEGGNHYALDLLHQVKGMNRGVYLDDTLENANPTDFCMGVAGYPEKHFEAPSLKSDLKYLKQKVDAGAEYIITQMFFDNQKFFDYEKKCRDMGIKVPIIPGLKPLKTKAQLSTLPAFFKIDLPDELVEAVESCKDNHQVKQVGIEWSIRQSKELKAHGAPVLHYYSMGKSSSVQKIAEAIF